MIHFLFECQQFAFSPPTVIRCIQFSLFSPQNGGIVNILKCILVFSSSFSMVGCYKLVQKAFPTKKKLYL